MSRKLLIGLCGVIACVVLVTHLLLAHAVDRLTHDTTQAELARITHTLALDPILQKANTPTPELHDHLANFAARTDTRLTLVRPDGVVIADTAVGFDELRTLERHSDRPEITDARSQDTGFSIRHSDTRNEDTLYLARRLDDSDNILRAARPKPDVEAEADAIRELLYWIATATLIGALVFSLVMARWLALPIRAFASETRQITRGGPNTLSRRATNTAELVELAAVVSELLDELARLRSHVRTDSPQLTALLEALPWPALVINPLGQIERANPAAYVTLELVDDTRNLEDIRLGSLRDIIRVSLEGDAPLGAELTRDVDEEDDAARYRAHVAPITRLDEPVGAVVVLEPMNDPD